MEDFVIHKPTIDDLNVGTEVEHLFSKFAYQLEHGRDVDGHWLQIVKLNVPKSKDDPAIYEVDFGIQEDGEIIGYIDLEMKKSGWHEGVWTYPRTNIPLYPMEHWKSNHFNGNHTVKLQRFSQKPRMSFWIAVRTDWGALWVVWFRHLVEHGERTTQPTRYSLTPLPVIAVPNQYCTLIDNADHFTRYIIDHYKEVGR